MMKICTARTTFRPLAAAAMLALSAIVAPAAAPSAALAAPVAAPAEAPSSAYMDQLLSEINARRARAGTAPIAYAPGNANPAVSQYLADLTPMMVSMRSCFHGMNNPVAPGWDYVAASGLNGEARGEVLACPGDGYYWSAKAIADGWWNSPSHFRSLYADPNANAVACGAYGAGRNGNAYQTVACVTYRI